MKSAMVRGKSISRYVAKLSLSGGVYVCMYVCFVCWTRHQSVQLEIIVSKERSNYCNSVLFVYINLTQPTRAAFFLRIWPTMSPFVKMQFGKLYQICHGHCRHYRLTLNPKRLPPWIQLQRERRFIADAG